MQYPIIIADLAIAACTSLDPEAITAAHNMTRAWDSLQDRVGAYERGECGGYDVRYASARYNDALAHCQQAVAMAPHHAVLP